MASTGIISLELVVNLRRSLQLLLQAVCPDKWSRTVHLIKIPYFLRNLNMTVVIIKFLFHQFITEYNPQLFSSHRL